MTLEGEPRRRLNEIYEINRRFLELIGMRAGQDAKEYFGLPEDVARRIGDLGPSALDAVAMVPVMLVTAARRDVPEAGSVHDVEELGPKTYYGSEIAEQNFAAAFLTWLAQDAQQHNSLSSLWLGTDESRRRDLENLSLAEIQHLARHAGQMLKARFSRRPDVWRDLIQAAQSNDPQRQHLARLAVLPKSYPIGRRKRPDRGRRRR